MSKAEINEKINSIEKFQRERTSGTSKKQEWPSQEKCMVYKNQVKEILVAMGARGAYISDVSMVGDFEGLWGVTEETSKEEADKITGEKCREISSQLGIDEIKATDYIVEVAQKLKGANKLKDALVHLEDSVTALNKVPGRTCGNGCGCK